MATDRHQTLDLASVQRELTAVFEKVISSRQRVEIQSDAGAESCVIISKAELDSIERALQIFSETDTYKTMADTLAQLALMADDRVASR